MSNWMALAALAAAQNPSGSTSAASAPSPVPPPACSTAEYRQLDFWVGDWVATFDNGDGTKGTGRNRITRDEYGDCVITEHFTTDDGSMKGHSISMYVKQAGGWRQTWMDNQGGYFDLAGGPGLEPSAKFGLETIRQDEKMPFRRMIWQDVKPDSFTWRWQGKAKAADAWKDQWVIHYTRAGTAASATK